jgi:hypothetical protein
MKRPKPKEIRCPACEGTGFPNVKQPVQPGRKIYPPPCKECSGKGQIESQPERLVTYPAPAFAFPNASSSVGGYRTPAQHAGSTLALLQSAQTSLARRALQREAKLPSRLAIPVRRALLSVAWLCRLPRREAWLAACPSAGGLVR